MKTCFKCGKTKPVESFHRHSGMKDGRLNKCASCVLENVKNWRDKNPGSRSAEYKRAKSRDSLGYKAKAAARASKRRRTVNNAQPKWADTDYIVDLYTNTAEANALFEKVGIYPKFEVDHVIPLQHNKVCGLHVEHNLQIIPAEQNRRKSNKFKVV